MRESGAERRLLKMSSEKEACSAVVRPMGGEFLQHSLARKILNGENEIQVNSSQRMNAEVLQDQVMVFS